VNHAELSNGQFQIPVSEIDKPFLEHFISKLQSDGEFSDFIEQGEKEEIAVQQIQISDILTQIKAAEDTMRDIEATIGQVKNPKLAKIRDEQYTACENDLLRLQLELSNTQALKTKAQERRTFKRLMQEVGEFWEDIVKPEEVPIAVRNFVDKVVIRMLSPRFYELTVYWSDPQWGIEEAICVRNHHTSTNWTVTEDEILQQDYPTMSRKELLQKLSNRTWKTVIHRATQLEIRRKIREYDIDCPSLICWNDWLLMKQYQFSQKEFLHGKICPKFGPRHNQFTRDSLRP